MAVVSAVDVVSPTSSVIVLTQGGRTRELDALVESLVLAPTTEAFLVANGGPVTPLANWNYIESSENLGVPGGRNLGAQHANGDYLIFIDDDAVSMRPDLVDAVEQRFANEPGLGVIGFRIVKPGSTESQQRWTPHVGMGDTTRTADVTTFVGGGHAIRRGAFEEVGGYWDPLFYSLEETDLSWRLLDAGWRISFDADLILEHPDIGQDRHRDVLHRTARNRVWVARRNLRWPLACIYCSVWLALQTVRARSVQQLRQIVAGTWQGMSTSAGDRRPIKWSTVRTMARLGRPPVI